MGTLTNEDNCIQVICCDCGGTMRKWTEREIRIAKEDLGMDETDDFCDVCPACAVNNYKRRRFKRPVHDSED